MMTSLRRDIADNLRALGRGLPDYIDDDLDIGLETECECDPADLDLANDLIRQIDEAATAKGNMIIRLKNVLTLLEEFN